MGLPGQGHPDQGDEKQEAGESLQSVQWEHRPQGGSTCAQRVWALSRGVRPARQPHVACLCLAEGCVPPALTSLMS